MPKMNAPTRKVVITGVGLLTPLGISLDALARAFAGAQSAIWLEPGAKQPRVAARVAADLDAPFTRQQLGLYDRGSKMTMLAGAAAFADAGLAPGAYDPARSGVFLGSGCGPSHSYYETYRSIIMDDHCKGLGLLRCLTHAPAGHLSMEWDVRGACQTYAIACASSTVAIGEALRAIRHGYLDMAIAGGAETPLGEGVVRAWEAMRLLARPDAEQPHASCRPFSRNRGGVVLGEGAAFYILEAEEAARARGATIHARLLGYGTSADAQHITSPSAQGQAAAMGNGLADAGLAPADIGYLNAHGTATKVGDAMEACSIGMTFGKHTTSLPISSTKSMHGHLLGASGAVELSAAIIALRQGLIPPTANLDQPDEELALDFVPNHARTGARIGAAMSNTFAFGGTNACLVLA
jgi:3-oxoacyl-[acyl-carrier-protein] synthase II